MTMPWRIGTSGLAPGLQGPGFRAPGQRKPLGLLSTTVSDLRFVEAAMHEIIPLFNQRRKDTFEVQLSYETALRARFEKIEDQRRLRLDVPFQQVPRICDLMVAAQKDLGFGSDLNPDFLNVIVRRYKPGRTERLGFHKDAIGMFTENIFGCVVINDAPPPRPGLTFRRGNDYSTSYVCEEYSGATFCLTEVARYDYLHGVDYSDAPGSTRLSVTWRWFRRDYVFWGSLAEQAKRAWTIVFVTVLLVAGVALEKVTEFITNPSQNSSSGVFNTKNDLFGPLLMRCEAQRVIQDAEAHLRNLLGMTSTVGAGLEEYTELCLRQPRVMELGKNVANERRPLWKSPVLRWLVELWTVVGQPWCGLDDKAAKAAVENMVVRTFATDLGDDEEAVLERRQPATVSSSRLVQIIVCDWDPTPDPAVVFIPIRKNQIVEVLMLLPSGWAWGCVRREGMPFHHWDQGWFPATFMEPLPIEEPPQRAQPPPQPGQNLLEMLQRAAQERAGAASAGIAPQAPPDPWKAALAERALLPPHGLDRLTTGAPAGGLTAPPTYAERQLQAAAAAEERAAPRAVQGQGAVAGAGSGGGGGPPEREEQEGTEERAARRNWAAEGQQWVLGRTADNDGDYPEGAPQAYKMQWTRSRKRREQRKKLTRSATPAPPLSGARLPSSPREASPGSIPGGLFSGTKAYRIAVNLLVSAGFDRVQAERALAANDMDVDRATEELLASRSRTHQPHLPPYEPSDSASASTTASSCCGASHASSSRSGPLAGRRQSPPSPEDDDDDGGRVDHQAAQWYCAVCTFANHAELPMCEMCGGARSGTKVRTHGLELAECHNLEDYFGYGHGTASSSSGHASSSSSSGHASASSGLSRPQPPAPTTAPAPAPAAAAPSPAAASPPPPPHGGGAGATSANRWTRRACAASNG